MLTIDLHCHSIASVHAMNTIEELLYQADLNGMEGIALTDHCPGMDNTIWVMKNELSNPWEHVIKGTDYPYFKVFVSRYVAPERFCARLFKGIECNILGKGPTATDVPLEIVDQLDLVIASLHPLPAFEIKKERHLITERILMAMDDPIDVLGHPCQKGYCPDLEKVVEVARHRGIALEINNASLQLGKAETGNVRKMLEMVKKREGLISLGSDAHVSTELGSDDAIVKILKESEFPEELIVNKDLASTENFIGNRKKNRRNR